MIRRVVAGLLLAFALAWTSPVTADESDDKGLTGQRMDVAITVLPDGRLRVRETLVVSFADRRTKRFERVRRYRGFDRLSDVVATMDGAALPSGTRAGQVEIANDDRLRVRWHFEGAANATHTFGLEYVVAGALVPSGGRGKLRWTAVQGDRPYPIGTARVVLAAPAGVVFYDGSGLAEAGWSVERTGEGFVAAKSALGRRDTGTFLAEMSADQFGLVEPQWVFEQQRADRLMPAFVSGAIFILLIGAGVIWMIRFQYPSDYVRNAEAVPAELPMSPALVHAVAHRYLGPRPSALGGTLVDLAGRGVLVLRVPSKNHVSVTIRGGHDRLLAHERVVLDAVSAAETPEGLSSAKLRGRLFAATRRFGHALTEDLLNAGYGDADRVSAARGLRYAGLASFVLAGVCAAAIAFFMPGFGPWPMLLPASIAVVALALVIAGSCFSTLTAEGERVSAAWRRRLHWLRRLKNATRDELSMEQWARWLPLATSAGRGEAWVKLVASRPAGIDQVLTWWTGGAGESRTESLQKFLAVVGRDPTPKAH